MFLFKQPKTLLPGNYQPLKPQNIRGSFITFGPK